VALPSKFRPIVLVKFEGNTNPKEFLALYSTDMVAARANEKIMANRFPMALKGMFLSWLMHFPRESIRYWEELCTRFVRAFQGGFKRHGMLIQLHAIVKREGERLRDFMMWFSQVAHTIPKAEDAAIIGVFMMNVCDKKMREKLNMHPVRNTHELWALAGFYSLAEEGRLEPEDAAREAAIGANPGSAATKRGGSCKRRPPQFLAAEPSALAGAKKKTHASEEVVAVKPATKKWCPVHESDEHNACIFCSIINYAEGRKKSASLSRGWQCLRELLPLQSARSSRKELPRSARPQGSRGRAWGQRGRWTRMRWRRRRKCMRRVRWGPW
jgi:hypothetical protein